MSTSIDLRCDRDPRRLFAKIRSESGKLPQITDDNLFEVACRDCVKAYRNEGLDIKQVFHRFNAIGEAVETERLYVNGTSDLI